LFIKACLQKHCSLLDKLSSRNKLTICHFGHFGEIWSFSAIFANLGYFWPFLQLWAILAIFGHFCNFGQFRLFFDHFGNFWQFSQIFRLFLAICNLILIEIFSDHFLILKKKLHKKEISLEKLFQIELQSGSL
jgi:hypothetical protein